MALLNCVKLLALAGAFANALPATTVRSEYAVKERHVAPRGWSSTGPADKRALVNLQIGLKQRDADLVVRHLEEVSNPRHKRYGQHLTAREVRELVTPADDTVELVEEWLAEHGVSKEKVSYSPARDWISIVVPISKVEELLQTSYSTYTHKDGSELVRVEEWSLPLHLHEHIDLVQPTTSFLRLQPRAKYWVGDDGADLPLEVSTANVVTASSGSTVADLCNVTNTTPDCLRTLYGTINYTVQAPERNAVGICNYLNETNKRSDVKQFLQKYRPEAAAVADTFDIEIIANAPNNQGNYTAEELENRTNVEGNLDAELVLAISWPTPMTAFSTGGSPPFIPSVSTPTDTNEPYLVFLNAVLDRDDLPWVISSSYGDDEQTVPESYARRACAGFAQLGARGISVLFSSGDAGVGSDDTCFSNDGKNTTKFTPDFPTSCPWVTSVGGTANFNPETAVTRFASGAGFSNYFPVPEYQRTTVAAYVASLNGTYDGLYNKHGRAYPDVAAQGNHDAIVWNGTFRTVGGTSASAPTFAAIVALVNDALIAKGRGPLGFLNPWIYGGAYTAFTDVTIGSSFGCNTNGFPAQAGWDAVTGFGTPNFDKLVKLAFKKW